MQTLAYLRNTLGKELNLIDPNKYCFLWVNNWPSFEWSEEENRYMLLTIHLHHQKMNGKINF